MALKSDKIDVERIYENKADKNDCENIADSVKILNSQLQHTVILLNEALRLNLTKG